MLMRFILLALALPLAASESELGFAISGIRVDGAVRVSQEWILQESGLQEGQTYTEKELTQARRRLLRLPHLLHTDLRLEKGASYGQYTLVISIKEVSPLFFRYDFTSLDQKATNAPIPLRGTDVPSENMGQLALGTHGFWGPWWHWYATSSLDQVDDDFRAPDGAPFDVGISHHNLLGRNLFLNLNLQHRGARDGKLYDPFIAQNMDYTNNRDLAPTLDLALPFFGRSQWLALEVSYLAETFQFRDEGRNLLNAVKSRRTVTHLTWYRDTTDDLILPRVGTRLEMGLTSVSASSNFSIALDRPLAVGEATPQTIAVEEVYANLPAELRPLASYNEDILNPQVDGLYKARGLTAKIKGAIYQPVTQNLTGFARGFYRERLSESGALIRDPDLQEEGLSAGMDYDLTALMSRPLFHDLRLALEADYEKRSTTFTQEKISGIDLSLSWRLRWGLSRLVLRYEDTTFSLPEEKRSTGAR